MEYQIKMLKKSIKINDFLTNLLKMFNLILMVMDYVIMNEEPFPK
jgi:hypothetical protein